MLQLISTKSYSKVQITNTYNISGGPEKTLPKPKSNTTIQASTHELVSASSIFCNDFTFRIIFGE